MQEISNKFLENLTFDKEEFVVNTFKSLRAKGVIHSQKDFANLIGFSEASISRALKGDERFLTDSLISKIQAYLNFGTTAVSREAVAMFPALDSAISPAQPKDTLLVIPTEAMAGTLGEFADSVASYDCERMISPIKGADYAIKVCGDSMSPEYPSGCQVLIKKVNERAFVEWGKVYVLDTENGAVVKKIRKTSNDSVIECVSLNPEYQPFTIETKYIRGWYRVLMMLSLK